jgi:hypothetical protein
MNKLPIGQTIAFGYAFLVNEFSTVVRICWIPSLLVVAVEYLGNRYTLYYAADAEGAGFALADFAVVFFVMAITLYSSSVMAVGVTRAAMKLPISASTFYFPIGGTEWRMLGANVRYILAVVVLLLLAGIASAVVLLLAGVDFTQPAEAQPASLGTLIGSLISFLIVGYAVVSAARMAFFLPAVVVTEDKGLERAYSAAAGNVWRILVVLVAIAVPFLIVGTVVQTAFGFSTFGEDVLSGDMEDMMANMEEAVLSQPLLWAVYGFIYNIALMGVLPSAAAFAFLKVTEGARNAPSETTPPPRA